MRKPPSRSPRTEWMRSMQTTDALAHLLKNLRDAMAKYPDQNWDDALAWGQLRSKVWLVEELTKLDLDLGRVFVLAGWVGILPALMLHDKRLRYTAVRSFDIDPSCAVVADTVNRDPYVIHGWAFKASTADVFAMDYDSCSYTTHRWDGSPVSMTESPDTIINTSCDHIMPFERFYDRIPSGKLVVLQNNDFVEADETHTNTIGSLDDFRTQAPMSTVLYEGELPLSGYTRFMRIGFR